MPLDFPDNPSNGDIFQGYVYDSTRNVWDIKLAADQNLEDLNNVNVTTPADGQALIYDAANTEWTSGDVASGPAPTKIISSDSINVDFSDGIELEKRAVTGDVTFTGSNYTSGVKKTIYLEGDTVQRSLTLPNEWTFLTDTPTAIGASKNNILDLNSFGTSASTTVGIWLGQNAFEPIVASGGTVTEIDVSGVTYKVHAFTGNEANTFAVSDVGDESLVEYLVVGGGGGGGAGWYAGGGGAGGYTASTFTVENNSYPITLGAGGNGSTSVSSRGALGGSSSIFGVTVLGGGGGGSRSGERSGGNGGSGGGAAIGVNSGGTGQSGQGNPGGNCSSGQYGAAGGGAAAAGGSGIGSPYGRDGAVGLQNSIRYGYNVYYAGGGAGADATTVRVGGLGGGGNAATSSGLSAVNGQPNTGGGGGGGTATESGSGLSGINRGSNGGSGIVLIRYPITDPN